MSGPTGWRARPAPALAAEVPALLRTAEAAAILHMAPRTVIAWAQSGRLPSIRTPGGQRRYPAEAVERLAITLACPEAPADPGRDR